MLTVPAMADRLGMAQLRTASFVVFAACAGAGCSESHTNTGDDAGPSLSDVSCVCLDAGPDAPLLYPDAPPIDGGGIASCAADDARGEICPDAICDGFDNYAWDGERCFRIDCGTCEGSDCGSLPTSLEACRAAHATCVPEQCRATGGEWLFFTEECEHYVCGNPQPVACIVGMPVCNCGSGRSFSPGSGCFDDATCPEVDPLPPETLCGDTGGTWTPGICCHTTCGVMCDDDCAAPGCVCGPMEVFDSLRGCVPGLECYEREAGETCTLAHTRCGEGLLCCAHCGGAGCSPDSTCEAPTCDGDPTIDECGNNLLAP